MGAILHFGGEGRLSNNFQSSESIIESNYPIVKEINQNDKIQGSVERIFSYLRSEYPLTEERLKDIHKQVATLKEDEFLHLIHKNTRILIGKIGGKWIAEPITSYVEGGRSKVELTNSLALHILYANEYFQKRTLENQKTVFKRTHKGGNAIGIIPPPVGFVKKTYYVENEWTQEYPVNFWVDKRFIGDLSTSKFSIEEAPQICAHLALGVQALHEAHLHHLDIKPANILYAGNGVAYLTDFEGIIKSDPFDFFLPSLMYTPIYLRQEDLEKLKFSWFFSKEASQIDVFALGSTFYQIALRAQGLDNSMPYFIKNWYAGPLKPAETLQSILEIVYTKEQSQTILQMLNPDGNQRPSIQEIVKVFPLDPSYHTFDKTLEPFVQAV